MSIITISRGTCSGGKLLAERVAAQLGYRCIDRDLIVEKAAAYGISQEALRTALEQPPKLFGPSKHTRYVYLAIIQTALTQEVWSGDAVYHGLAGHLLLAGVPHVLRARIIAPMEFRIRMVEERMQLPHAEAAAYIEKTDHDRRKWTHFLYGVHWDDPSLYDVVLNLDRMGIEEASDTLCGMTRQPAFQFTPECARAVEDMAFATRIRASLALDPATSDLELEVASKRGEVSVRGELLSPSQANDIRRILRAFPEIRSVQLNDEALPASVYCEHWR